MATKSFLNFTTKGDIGVPIKSLDYIVGYRPASSGDVNTPYEIQFTIKNLVTSLDAYLENKSINGNKIYFTPFGLDILRLDVVEKLNDVRATTDYLSPAAAGIACRGKRLFVARELQDQKITTDVTIIVPSTGASNLAEALYNIAGWHIEAGNSVTIRLTQDQDISSAYNLNHPQGSQIRIIGDKNGAGGMVNISTSNAGITYNAFECTNGNKWGLIDNVNITGFSGQYSDGWSVNRYAAIYASYGSYINLGSNVQISYWYYGLNASYGSVINAPNVIVSYCGEAGIYATCGSQITSTRASVSSCRIYGSDVGYGYKAEYNSQINCNLSKAESNKVAGYAAFSNSQIKANGGYARANGYLTGDPSTNSAGFMAREGGEIECYNYVSGNTTTNTNSDGNNGFGYDMSSGGYIAGSLNASGNRTRATNFKVTASWAGSYPNDYANVSASAGKLVVSTSDSSPVIFNTSNTRTQAIIQDNGYNTTTYITMAGGDSSTHVPTISSGGAGTNINLNLRSKGFSSFVTLGSAVQFGAYSTTNLALSTFPTGYITIRDSVNNYEYRLLAVRGTV